MLSHLNTSVQLFFVSGMVIFWLIPLSAWAMLRGRRDHNANLWFTGTAVYSVVVTLFVFNPFFPWWVNGPFISMLSALSVFFLFESLRREISAKPAPLRVYLSLLVVWFILIAAFFVVGQDLAGRALHLALLSALELGLIVVANRVRRQHQSRALWILIITFACFALSNMSRVLEFVLLGRFPLLQEFTLTGSVSLVMNYLSAIFYCFGYWGFVVEKSKRELVEATQKTVLAQQSEKLALEREEMGKIILQERTQLMQRLSSIGKMAQSGAVVATIAHEVNQPLASIRLNIGQAQHLAQELAGNVRLNDTLVHIEEDVKRAAIIIERVRSMFVQSSRIEPAVLDDIVEFVARLVRPRLQNYRIGLQLQLDAPIPLNLARGEMEHVLMNLIDNAQHALRESKVVNPEIVVRTWIDANNAVLSVHDNGPGINTEMQKNMFDLLATSKEDGLGLGLWLARFIVERQGGRIALQSGHGLGACFEVRLPRA